MEIEHDSYWGSCAGLSLLSGVLTGISQPIKASKLINGISPMKGRKPSGKQGDIIRPLADCQRRQSLFQIPPEERPQSLIPDD